MKIVDPPPPIFFFQIWILCQNSLTRELKIRVVGFVLIKLLTYFEMYIVPPALHSVDIFFLYISSFPHLTQSGLLFWFQCPPPPPPPHTHTVTLSCRKTSYRSLKQTAVSTSCPWTTILVLFCRVFWQWLIYYTWVVQWCWVNFQCQGVLLIWIIAGQGPTALTIGAGGGS